MATGTFYGTNYTKANAPTPSTQIDFPLWGGKVRVLQEQVFASGAALDAGSVMYCGKLPKGAIPLLTIVQPIASTGVPTVHTNAVTGSIGVTGDTNLLGTFTTLAAAGAAAQILSPIPDGTIYNGITGLTEANDIFITTAGAALVAAEGIAVKIFYAAANS